MNSNHTIEPIAHIKTPFNEKFGIPRQPNLCKAKGVVTLTTNFNSMQAVKGLERHSHIWLLFLFDQNLDKGWKPSVRPPRLGGNEKVGVFATRSTFRPNGIGMSVVNLISVKQVDNQIVIEVEGVDLVNNTPIIDIKPYIPYSDSVVNATSEMANDAPEAQLDVFFSKTANNSIECLNIGVEFITLIGDVLKQDPRPSYKQNKPDTKVYGIALEEFNITWQVTDKKCEVLNVEPI
ncbi:tRNA (N6-threonylcarbamoyladenosine(37)-N6)-methyltransferase TrmO [Psychrosphaera haliotis]|uniref:tRNA (N6-threonylcarbamoyladenosine(37)-N6)-methyltransferase TrmO n=1 Tax=Psychrosphaera haliotis TaxID=555083 RepID=A0A6N8F8T5_9GAMM|nr:tRNA (N6-threonylcarbamoyladenosine(37)-N6)-methyltransferase TrmO [Psychrosphaera haliotis]MUH71497.1 tRNA (N6-threonylcarbamoyladenosine(37)-N6)-methyltransferase TrmO [Psychrosphaera haliotis]